MLERAILPSALILRSRECGVSKDVPDVSGVSWSILRDAPAALLRMRAKGSISEHPDA
jgi:hypothetical protein